MMNQDHQIIEFSYRLIVSYPFIVFFSYSDLKTVTLDAHHLTKSLELEVAILDTCLTVCSTILLPPKYLLGSVLNGR